MSILLFLLVLYILLGVSMMKLFEKAGLPGWKALVPGVAAIEWAKLIGRKPQYALWLLFPIVNIFIYAGMVIDLGRVFGKHKFWHAALAVIFAPILYFMIGRNPDDKYTGPVLEQERAYHREYQAALEKKDPVALRKLENSPFRKSAAREWAEAIIFAVFAAAFIRMFLIEAYVIPTPSMEGTLKVGDFLFVSKAHYGIRTPMTVIQFPLVHNRFSQSRKGLMRMINTESYLREPSLPYYRLPAIENIDRFEPVVFNYPAGDSVIITPERNYDLYQWRRVGLDKAYPNEPIVTRPVDKKDHYIKRCVGVPGDSLAIRDAQLYINGQPAPNPQHLQLLYRISGQFNVKKLEEWGVGIEPSNVKSGLFFMDAGHVEKAKNLGLKLERVPAVKSAGYVYPNSTDPAYKDWTMDDFGPILIPKAGGSVALTPQSWLFYERLIRDFEHNTVRREGDKFFINGQETSTYTFKQDYYWMMGDNRHNSEDSRVWGYVPADHIVGKPLFIWFSTKNGNIREGINWNRLFKSASVM